MTGFASLTREDARATVGVTIRAVNHRYLDVQVRLPQSLAASEAALRALLQRHVARGRIELSVSVQLREPPAPEVELHAEFVRRLADAIERARQEGLVSGHLTPGDLVRIPQALVFKERAADAPEATGSSRGSSNRRSRRRWAPSTGCASTKASICGPTWTRGATRSR